MFRKFPQIAPYAPTELEEIALFRVTPEIISVLDYRKGFGHSDLVKVAGLKDRAPMCLNKHSDVRAENTKP